MRGRERRGRGWRRVAEGKGEKVVATKAVSMHAFELRESFC